MMETEEADETEGQSSEQRGLQAQVVITLLPGIFLLTNAGLYSSDTVYTIVWQLVYTLGHLIHNQEV